MEFYVFKIHLSHLKYITGVGKEHIASLSILCHILIFTFLESFQLCRIITFHPTSLIQTYRLPTTRCIILVLQTILNYLKLQLSHRTDNLTSIELIDKQLCHTFVHQLVDTFRQLLLFHRICVLNVLEHLR